MNVEMLKAAFSVFKVTMGVIWAGVFEIMLSLTNTWVLAGCSLMGHESN